MKKFIISCVLSLPLCTEASNHASCFLAKEKACFLKKEGDTETRFSPCSTFKIALSLIGFDTKIFQDATHPTWYFKKGYDAYKESWKEPQNPTSWIKNSCVWFSQELTSSIGIRCLGQYLRAFHYGNENLSGDKGKRNGLTHSWLSSSLEISPEEQAVFVQKLVSYSLPVTLYAHRMTQRILFVEELSHGWKLYGKTGSGYLLDPQTKEKTTLKHGWFVGWIEKEDRKIILVCHLVDETTQEEHAGPRAKEQTKEKALALIQELEKSAH